MTDMKPGVKTTEFWMTMIIQVLGILVMTGTVSPEQSKVIQGAAGQFPGLLEQMNVLVGGVMSLVSGVFYAFGRSKVKSK